VVNKLLNVLLDPGTFLSWDDPRESVITGSGCVAGHRVAIVASDFAVMGGSIGLVAGERLTRAVERATTQQLPLIAMPASGGTRMQEGTAAFLQMLRVTAAVTAHKAAGLPYLAYLRHPTTGGVLASWASLAHVTAAEPGALIGFLGPRVYEALAGTPFPAGIQTAEHLHARGLVDAVVPPKDLATYFGRVLAVLAPMPTDKDPDDAGGTRGAAKPDGQTPARAGVGGSKGGGAPLGNTAPLGNRDAWESVTRTRQPGRLRGADLLRATADDVATVREDGGLLLALARVGGTTVVCGAHVGDGPFGIRGLDLFLRGVRMAAELRAPLLTVIDTPGAELSVAAEEAGIAGKIAQCIAAMITLPVPTIAVLLGQGTGGGALALLPADRVLAAEHAWLAALAPEGASAIMYRDTAHAPELARAQGIMARDLAEASMVDQVVPEIGSLPAAVRAAVADLARRDASSRLAERARRLRALGVQ
jgi:acyl-CoA carboxylase subunit beta